MRPAYPIWARAALRATTGSLGPAPYPGGITMKKNLLIVGGAAALVMSSCGLALAAGGDQRPGRRRFGESMRGLPPPPSSPATAAPPRAWTRIVNSPFTFSETGVNDQDQAVPGANVTLFGPARGHRHPARHLLGRDPDHRRRTPTTGWAWRSTTTACRSTRSPRVRTSWRSPASRAGTATPPSSASRSAAVHTAFRCSATCTTPTAATPLNGWLDDYTLSVQRFD